MVVGTQLGNKTVEAIDTFAGRDTHSIAGAAEPRGVAYVGHLNRLFVANDSAVGQNYCDRPVAHRCVNLF